MTSWNTELAGSSMMNRQTALAKDKPPCKTCTVMSSTESTETWVTPVVTGVAGLIAVLAGSAVAGFVAVVVAGLAAVVAAGLTGVAAGFGSVGLVAVVAGSALHGPVWLLHSARHAQLQADINSRQNGRGLVGVQDCVMRLMPAAHDRGMPQLAFSGSHRARHASLLWDCSFQVQQTRYRALPCPVVLDRKTCSQSCSWHSPACQAPTTAA